MPVTNNDFIVTGKNQNALFSLKIFRGDGMVLLGMNWKSGKPPKNFVGFSIEYKTPGSSNFKPLVNTLSFADKDGNVSKTPTSTLQSPIQKFRWIHFPNEADIKGLFAYKVKPVFMDADDQLSFGESQQCELALIRETHPGKINVTFTRGFVSSQAFVKKFGGEGAVSKIIPVSAKTGLTFKPTHPKATEALDWMGFEARTQILELLKEAVKDKKATVRAICYDLNEPEIVASFEKLGKRLQVIIDDSKDHKAKDDAESIAAKRLTASGATVKRHHMSNLQHNKTIIVESPTNKKVLCGSTNFSWRGFFVQANNALFLTGAKAIKPFIDAFDGYMISDSKTTFGKTPPAAVWHDLQLNGIKAKVTFSPHAEENAVLSDIAKDVLKAGNSSLIYSLAFLAQTKGSLTEAIAKIIQKDNFFSCGISDKRSGGLMVQRPDGISGPVFIKQLTKDIPEPFKSEPSGLSGGRGTRMHHKFIVIDFNKPSARVYMGSYNFSNPADKENGENLLLIEDQKIAVAYMIEGMRLFDHYEFRIAKRKARTDSKPFALLRPPKNTTEKAWWEKYYSKPKRIKDRQLFS